MLLADPLEQARGHAAAHCGRVDLGDIDPLVAIARPLERQREMCLLEVARDAPLAAGKARARGDVLRPVLQMAEEPLGLRHHRVVVDIAGGGHDHPARAVVRLHEIMQVGLRERVDPFDRTQDRAPERLTAIGLGLQPVEDHVVGRVERLADLRQDHAALGLDLGILEQRVEQDVGDHLHREGHVGAQYAGVVGGGLAAGVGVDVAADVLDLLGDAARGPGAGALERHVLEKVGDPVLRLALVPGAGVDPDPHRGAPEAGHPLGHDPEAVGQGVGDGLVDRVAQAGPPGAVRPARGAVIGRRSGGGKGPVPAGRRPAHAPRRG